MARIQSNATCKFDEGANLIHDEAHQNTDCELGARMIQSHSFGNSGKSQLSQVD